MINLLPPETRENILYARRNTKLLRWVFSLSVAMIGIVIVVVVGQFYLSNVSKNLQSQVTQGKAELEAQKISQTQGRVEEISASLKLALQVLSRQVLFSKLLDQIGSAMPPGAALLDLRIAQVQGGIDIQAGAVDYETATQVQVNLQDSANKIFSKADIVNIDCKPKQQSPYLCTIVLRAQFADNNSFTFLSSKGGTAR